MLEGRRKVSSLVMTSMSGFHFFILLLLTMEVSGMSPARSLFWNSSSVSGPSFLPPVGLIFHVRSETSMMKSMPQTAISTKNICCERNKHPSPVQR